jgi:hypothetical protein
VRRYADVPKEVVQRKMCLSLCGPLATPEVGEDIS